MRAARCCPDNFAYRAQRSATVGTVAYRVLIIASAVELYVLLQIKGLHDLIIMVLHRWFIKRCMLAGDGLNSLSTDDKGGIVNNVLVTVTTFVHGHY